MPTQTWQAYNHRDDDGNGTEDTWYASGDTARLGRAAPEPRRPVPLPELRRAVPPLAGRRRTTTSTCSPTRTWARRAARSSRAAYALIVFPGHHEYVTEHEYDAVIEYRNRGGNLIFLSANNFFWKIGATARSCSASRSGATSAGPRRR